MTCQTELEFSGGGAEAHTRLATLVAVPGEARGLDYELNPAENGCVPFEQNEPRTQRRVTLTVQLSGVHCDRECGGGDDYLHATRFVWVLVGLGLRLVSAVFNTYFVCPRVLEQAGFAEPGSRGACRRR